MTPHVWPYQLTKHHFMGLLQNPKFRKVTFVRNPYSRLLSCYLHRIVNEPDSPSNATLAELTGGVSGSDVSFARFIELICEQPTREQERHWREQYGNVLFPFVDKFSLVGKQETLAEDMRKLSAMFDPKKRIELDEEANVSPMKTGATERLRSYYTDDLQRRVAERYKLDFETFGYDPEVLG